MQSEKRNDTLANDTSVVLDKKDIWRKHLHWPKLEEKRKTRNFKNPMPYAIVSEKWKNYYDSKEKEKQAKLDEIEKRKEERKRKKEQITQVRGKKLRRRERKTKKNQNPLDKVEIKVEIGEFVIVNYENKFYPGEVIDIDIDEKDYKVSTLESRGQNWAWPKKKDIIWYKSNTIIKKIQKPTDLDVEGSRLSGVWIAEMLEYISKT